MRIFAVIHGCDGYTYRNALYLNYLDKNSNFSSSFLEEEEEFGNVRSDAVLLIYTLVN